MKRTNLFYKAHRQNKTKQNIHFWLDETSHHFERELNHICRRSFLAKVKAFFPRSVIV
jgi:hypothetical protein